MRITKKYGLWLLIIILSASGGLLNLFHLTNLIVYVNLVSFLIGIIIGWYYTKMRTAIEERSILAYGSAGIVMIYLALSFLLPRITIIDFWIIWYNFWKDVIGVWVFYLAGIYLTAIFLWWKRRE